MDNKEGGSINRPPVPDGTNYDYWKERMVASLKSIYIKTWKTIVKGWTTPVNTQKEVLQLLSLSRKKQNGQRKKMRKPLQTPRHLMISSMELTRTCLD